MMKKDTMMNEAANTPGICILISAIVISMFALGIAIAAASDASQTREYFCVDLQSPPGEGSSAGVQFHLTSHALTYVIRYRPSNPAAQLTSLQILKSGILVSELCAGSDCLDLEQDTCSALGEPTHCGAISSEVVDNTLVRDMRRNPLLYSWHGVTTDTTLDSLSMGFLCAFF